MRNETSLQKESVVATTSKPMSSLYVEKCNLFLRRGFTTIAISPNNNIGRLCALRKSDFKKRLDFLNKGRLFSKVKIFIT